MAVFVFKPLAAEIVGGFGRLNFKFAGLAVDCGGTVAVVLAAVGGFCIGDGAVFVKAFVPMAVFVFKPLAAEIVGGFGRLNFKSAGLAVDSGCAVSVVLAAVNTFIKHCAAGAYLKVFCFVCLPFAAVGMGITLTLEYRQGHFDSRNILTIFVPWVSVGCSAVYQLFKHLSVCKFLCGFFLRLDSMCSFIFSHTFIGRFADIKAVYNVGVDPGGYTSLYDIFFCGNFADVIAIFNPPRSVYRTCNTAQFNIGIICGTCDLAKIVAIGNFNARCNSRNTAGKAVAVFADKAALYGAEVIAAVNIR